MIQQHHFGNRIAGGISGRAVAAALTVFVACGGACREEAPPPRFNRNLGTAARPLLPTPKLAFDESLYKDRADGIEDLADLENAPASDTPEDSPKADHDKIAKLIEAVRAANADKDFERFADYVVERQRDIVRGSAEESRKAAVAAEDLVAAMESADPPPPFAAQIIPALRAALEFAVSIDDVTLESDVKASAPFLTAQIVFEKEGSDWFIVSPDLAPTLDQEKRSTAAVAEAMTEATRALGDSTLSVADRNMQIAVALQKMAAAAISPPDEPDGG